MIKNGTCLLVETEDVVAPELSDAASTYDNIMTHIEPELTTDQIMTLKQKYAGESSDAATERADRYTKAFDQYEHRLDDFFQLFFGKIITFRRHTLKGMETIDRAQELSDMDDVITRVNTL